MSQLVISLDFELFWGVTDSKTIKNYAANIEGEWRAVPAMLSLFEKYDIKATWATVGMIMCKDFQHWSEMIPSVLPTYSRDKNLSAYSAASLAKEYPNLFFARPLVEQILDSEGQEFASHTYSHFYCGENGVTTAQFAADIECQKQIFSEFSIKPTSLVFPRNQIRFDYLNVVSSNGITVYRGNQDHWLYRDGHSLPYGLLGRVIRGFDSYFTLSGYNLSNANRPDLLTGLKNIPASCFLRPSSGSNILDSFHLSRVRRGMLEAAITGGIFHLWWHPHNFGVNLDRNLHNLECLLRYYCVLKDKYGMRSETMCNSF